MVPPPLTVFPLLYFSFFCGFPVGLVLLGMMIAALLFSVFLFFAGFFFGHFFPLRDPPSFFPPLADECRVFVFFSSRPSPTGRTFALLFSARWAAIFSSHVSFWCGNNIWSISFFSLSRVLRQAPIRLFFFYCPARFHVFRLRPAISTRRRGTLFS